jgi:hypothetical protein
VGAVKRVAAGGPAVLAEQLEVVDREHPQLMLDVLAAFRLERDVQAAIAGGDVPG